MVWLYRLTEHFGPFTDLRGLQAPPELHAEIFKQAQQYVGRQGTSADDFQKGGFKMEGIFGKILGK